jgi:hypothetical protein
MPARGRGVRVSGNHQIAAPWLRHAWTAGALIVVAAALSFAPTMALAQNPGGAGAAFAPGAGLAAQTSINERLFNNVKSGFTNVYEAQHARVMAELTRISKDPCLKPGELEFALAVESHERVRLGQITNELRAINSRYLLPAQLEQYDGLSNELTAWYEQLDAIAKVIKQIPDCAPPATETTPPPKPPTEKPGADCWTQQADDALVALIKIDNEALAQQQAELEKLKILAKDLFRKLHPDRDELGREKKSFSKEDAKNLFASDEQKAEWQAQLDKVNADGNKVGFQMENLINKIAGEETELNELRKKKCPPEGSMRMPSQPDIFVLGQPFTGLNGGLQITKTSAFLDWVESFPDGARSNGNSARGDPLGAGVTVGYGFMPWAGVNNLVINPFLSFDDPNSKVNYTFPSGNTIGAKSNYQGTAGVKIGPATSSVWLYAIAGVSVLNEKLTVNFAPVSSSTTTTVAGSTFGLGGAIRPGWLQVFGVPTSLSLEAQHTWWNTANFNMPASSPFFNYAFKRQDSSISLGLHFYLH